MNHAMMVRDSVQVVTTLIKILLKIHQRFFRKHSEKKFFWLIDIIIMMGKYVKKYSLID